MEIQTGKLYDVPFGMGGTFTVRALVIRGDLVDCRVFMPKNPDWHNYVVVAKAAEMKRAYDFELRSLERDLLWARHIAQCGTSVEQRERGQRNVVSFTAKIKALERAA